MYLKNGIRIHKELNRATLPFFKEKAIDLFTEIMKAWNQMECYEPLKFQLTMFKQKMGLSTSYNEDYLDDFIQLFSKESTKKWEMGNNEVYGNIFTIVVNKKEDFMEIHFNQYLLDYIFTQKDINLMKKCKRKETLSITEQEEYKQNKEKFSNLMLYSKADIEGLSGKYSKRLYMLLIQFKSKGFFKMNYIKFKEVLEIPSTYRQTNIDQRVLKPCMNELKKVGIEIIKIDKLKNGGKSIQTIEISFNYHNEVTKKVKETLIKTDLLESLEEEHGISTDEVCETGLASIKKLRENLKKK